MTETTGKNLRLPALARHAQAKVACAGLLHPPEPILWAGVDPRLRQLLIGLAACVAATAAGFAVAQEDYMWLSLAAALCLWAVLARHSDARAEAWLLGGLVVGYTIGNRGFAQLAPLAGIPVFIGEIALGFSLSVLIVRQAILRQIPIEVKWINRLLLFWLALGLSRIWWDFRNFGLLAVRDFAMVYYLLFFFCAQSLGRHGPSRRVLLGLLGVTYAALPLTALLVDAFPGFFLYQFTFQGAPVIHQKGDLRTLGLFAGFIWLLPRHGQFRQDDWWRWTAALGSLALGLGQLSRASMLGLGLAVGILTLARRRQPLFALLAVIALGAGFLSVSAVVRGGVPTHSRLYAVYESIVSIADVGGTRVYQSADAGNKGDNNRYRLVWWKTVIDDTVAVNPLLGLGFGADIARNFVREYYANESLEFTARSPHNIFVTTFARMGALGTLGLLTIYLCQAAATWRLVRQARVGNGDFSETLVLHAISWLMMVGACFGVVLEGPMGAIPFWIILGLAHSRPAGADEGK